MGLGPPVCKPCKKIMKLDNEKKKWSCPVCGKGQRGEDATNLFLIPKANWPDYE